MSRHTYRNAGCYGAQNRKAQQATLHCRSNAMKSLKGRVAVVTGAASGIGLALAERFAAEGMKVVLADVEIEPLGRAAHSLRSAGAEVLAVPTDVSKADQVDRLAQQ